MIKKKRGQLMHMSFSMIFSIILIIAFIVTTFYVIRHFINTSNCGAVASFYNDFQQEVDSIWNSEGASTTFTETLPSGIEYVCFVNYTRSKDFSGLNSKERQIASKVYDELYNRYQNVRANVFMYPTQKACY